jgi:DNA-binding NarL/FixJ family response regulator
VLLVGEDPLALGGLSRLLSDEGSDWQTKQAAPEGGDDENEDEEADAALVDLAAPSTRETIASLSRHYPVLALAGERTNVREVLAAGARGIVSRSATGARLARALDAILEGLVVVDEDLAEEALRPPPLSLGAEEELTPREKEVLELLALGLSNREIAGKLGISFHTVKFHVNSILGKLGASSRAEVVAIAARAGLLTF